MAIAERKRKTSQKEQKMVLNISFDMSKILVGYALSHSPTPNHLANFNKLLGILDLESYRNNYDIYNDLIICKMILDIRINEGITLPMLIKERILERDPTLKEACEQIAWTSDQVTGQDAKAIAKYIDNKMRYYFFYTEMPDIINAWQNCQRDGFDFSEAEFDAVNDRVAKLVKRMENSSIAPGLIRKFNFSDPQAGDIIEFVARKSQAPTSILQTGIRQLNANLGPGFRGGKLYCFLGMSGRFKSGTLLNIADQITKFNPLLEDVVDGKRNTVLFITAENTINETIERMYAMYADIDSPFLETDPAEIRRTILEKGKYMIKDDSKGIDIELRYFNNLEIKTAHIYNIIDEMELAGQHVIALIVDYIKRIDSVFPSNGDEILRQGYVAKELKSLSEYYNIPVITAQQINRSGNAIVDSAMRDNKADLLRFIGSSDIGGAWAVVEECDVVIMINLERHLKDNKLYLTFKVTKNRCKRADTTASDYFNHPFTNEAEIKLMTDLDKEASVSIMSLASDLESVNLDDLEKKTQDRPIMVKHSAASSASILEAIGVA